MTARANVTPTSTPRLRCALSEGAGAADLAALLTEIVECMMIIGHDGERVHAEVAMTFDLHERLEMWWRANRPLPALALVS
ncbi:MULTISPECIES: hypothetical protein [unclassified Chelatococcus]|uniref:hypothetical protein n=1 Tax=unclassified Chelatococcus TaxID=2638111 RepID=UPI001BCF6F4A|nr:MULTISPECIES: hypothetical protein [unclassified Chelatococcus]MBS7696224.1 hypothetical protein [Chelatococcus sp. YT9]MBX3557749.1 hypothetical protein [Chelatococcus sp.]